MHSIKKYYENLRGHRCHQRGRCILFSVVFTPPLPSHPPPPNHHGSVLLLHVTPLRPSNLTYHCIAGADLPIHMTGDWRGFVGTEKKTSITITR